MAHRIGYIVVRLKRTPWQRALTLLISLGLLLVGQPPPGEARAGNASPRRARLVLPASPVAAGVLVTQTVFLPVLFKDYSPPYLGLFEIEPNNVYTEATGPLAAGRTYLGYPDDLKDYFSIYAPVGGPITVTVENKTGTGTQLHLYYGQPLAGQYVAYKADPPFQFTCTTNCAGPGWYYIYLYTAANFNSTLPYTLTVIYP